MFHSNSAEFRKQTQFLYPIQRVFKGQAGTCSWNWVEASSRYVKRIGMRLSIFNFWDALFVFFCQETSQAEPHTKINPKSRPID